jgi:hypothetical protein
MSSLYKPNAGKRRFTWYCLRRQGYELRFRWRLRRERALLPHLGMRLGEMKLENALEFILPPLSDCK